MGFQRVSPKTGFYLPVPRAKQKNLAMGKKKFNMESKKGIQFLISHRLVAETPEEVAQFLYKEEGLNKTAIGDYLGEKNDFNEAVLKVFY